MGKLSYYALILRVVSRSCCGFYDKEPSLSVREALIRDFNCTPEEAFNVLDKYDQFIGVAACAAYEYKDSLENCYVP